MLEDGRWLLDPQITDAGGWKLPGLIKRPRSRTRVAAAKGLHPPSTAAVGASRTAAGALGYPAVVRLPAPAFRHLAEPPAAAYVGWRAAGALV